MKRSSIDRRDFLRRISAASALGLGASALVSACGGDDTQAPAAEADAPTSSDSFSCTDTSGLSEQEVAMRNQLQYVDETPNPEKNCLNCALYIPPAEGANCGGCNLLKGPIHPNGYCISWAPKQT